MNLTRRDFLRTSLGAGSLVSMGLTVPTFLSRTAAAAPLADKPGAKDTVLVVVQLTGGNDGLNTVIPFNDPEYAKLRPNLRIPTAQVKKLNDAVGLHPSMEGLAKLLRARALCVFQAVSYPTPSQSHFQSMDIWQAAATGKGFTEGWLGKALKHLPNPPAFHLARDNEISPLALAGAPVRAPSITSLEDFQLKMLASSGADKKEQRKVIEGVAQSQ